MVLCMFSGGASAMLALPPEGMSITAKQAITDALLKSGASIAEINTVRKHLSAIKGGRLAALAPPARLVTMVISDVIGNDPSVIGSGPTSPDPTTYADALAVLERYGITEPEKALDLLKRGAAGELPETIKPGDPCFDGTETIMIADNRMALDAAAKRARKLGMEPRILTHELAGDVADAARWLADQAKAAKPSGAPVCLLSGGETTVKVTGSGTGGRNTELALRFAFEIEGMENVAMVSAGTDGVDGPTDAAGAGVDGSTVARAREKGLDPEAYLRENDSYTFFEQAGGLIKTEPTGTNVMDVQVIVIS